MNKFRIAKDTVSGKKEYKDTILFIDPPTWDKSKDKVPKKR